MIGDGRFRLWRERAALVIRFFLFAVVITVIFIRIPRDAASRVQEKWIDLVEYVKINHYPIYEFISHKDMDRAAKEYESFKPR